MNFLLYCIMKHDSGYSTCRDAEIDQWRQEPLPTPLHFEGHVTLAANALRSIDILACFFRAYQVMMFNSVISTCDSSIKNLIFIKLAILKYGLTEEVRKCLFQSFQSQAARALPHHYFR